MPFKISCFNPTLFVHYLRRFWPLAAAVFLTVVFYPGLRILSAADPNGYYAVDAAYSSAQWALVAACEVMVPCMVVGAFAAAALAFRHLHERRASQFYLGLPVSRTCQFVTCCAAALTLVALPLLAGLGVCCLFAVMVGLPALTTDIVRLMGASLACLLIFAGMAVLSCVLTGRSLGALLVYAGANAALGVIILGYASSASYLLPGIQASQSVFDVVTWLVPAARLFMALSPDMGVGDSYDGTILGYSQPEVLVVYAVVGVVLLVLAGVLYRRRSADCTGDTVAYAPVSTSCKVMAALAVSAGLTFVIVESGFLGMWPSAPILAAVASVCLALGWFIAEMLVRRSLRVFDVRSLAQCGAMVLLLVACVVGMKLDVLGRVGYVPPADQVESAALAAPPGKAIEVDPADACAVHEAILRNRDLLDGEADANLARQNVTISYHLSNGAYVRRSYDVAFDGDNVLTGSGEVGATIRDVMSNPDYVMSLQFGASGDSLQPEMLVETEVYLDRGEFLDRGELPSAQGGAAATANAGGDASAASEGSSAAAAAAAGEVSNYAADSWLVDDGSMMVGLSRSDGFALYQAVCQDIREGNLTYDDYLAYSLSWISFIWRDSDVLNDRDMPYDAGNSIRRYATVGITPEMVHTRALLESLGVL